MCVDVDEGDRLFCQDITEVMAQGGFMTAAEDNRDGSVLEDGRHHRGKVLLRLFQGAADTDITEIKGWKGGQVGAADAVPDGEVSEPAAYLSGRLGRSGPAAVATHALVLGQAGQDCPPRPKDRRIAAPPE